MAYSETDFAIRTMKRKKEPEKSIYKDEYATVLRLLTAARKKSGVTQIDLAERLGQTQSFVSKVERGDRRLDIVQLRSILLEFGVTLPDFVRQLDAAISERRCRCHTSRAFHGLNNSMVVWVIRSGRHYLEVIEAAINFPYSPDIGGCE